MKTRSFILGAGLAMVAAAQAGTMTPEIPPASESSDIWRWFVGGSAGYLTDLDEGMYHLQAGVTYQPPGSSACHLFYLEAGFTSGDTGFDYSPPAGVVGGRTENASIDFDIFPITVNYAYMIALTERLKAQAGVGLGIAIVNTDYKWSWTQGGVAPPNNQGSGSDDDTDIMFYGNLFAGLTYAATESLDIFAGIRYILMDESSVDVAVTGVTDYDTGIDGDVLLEIGARWRF